MIKYSEPELVNFLEKIQKVNSSEDNEEIFDDDNISIFSLLPAYALSEIKSAFIIGFYIYLPFVVVDLVISSVLLTLGMMMMSPVTISTPIKLILFVAMDGWTMLSKDSFYNILTYPLIPEEKIWTILFLQGIGRCI
ncbi:Type III secretion apparatus protein EpaP [Escherichia coli]|uniref:Type III secretion apparatus protein EpaP n=1 Tax=Escherichia coli TaxID=562 RepID=A0A2X1N746_ECOLX|nr:Type III secretion apparatus protein EpaP [Escherichia coli]